MKKLALALAVIAAPMAANAESFKVEAPKVYGKLNLSYQMTDEKGEEFAEIVSNASRFGLKGKGQLDHALKAIYKVEFEVNADDGSKTVDKDTGDTVTISQRNVYAGIEGGFGQVITGKFDTPTKKLSKKVDLFNDLEGDVKSIITKSEKRESNSIQYTTPSLSGLKLAVDRVESEEDGGDNGTSLAVTYEQDMFFLGYGYDKDVRGADTEVSRLVAQVSIDALTLAALYENDEVDGNEDKDAFAVSAQYKLGKTKLKLQIGESDIVTEGGETISVGADYKVADNAKLYAFYTDESADDAAKDASYTGVGLEFKF